MSQYSYVPNDDEAKVARLVAKIRNTLNRNQTNLPKGETATKQEREDQQYHAILAEIAVSRVFNLCWTGCGKGSEGMRDVGYLLEVRSIQQSHLGLLVRDKDEDDSPIVLVLVDENRKCTLLGWEMVGNVKKHGRVLDGDTSKPAYIMRQEQLYPIKTLKTIVRRHYSEQTYTVES